MAVPSIGEILELVERGVKLYNKIKHDVPELVEEVAERIESLQLYLKRLQHFLKDENPLVKIRPKEKDDLTNILIKVKRDVAQVVKILEKWEQNKVGGLEFKYKFVAQAFFAMGSSPKELEDLGKKLDKRQDNIRDWMQLLSLWGQAELLKGTKVVEAPPKPSKDSRCNILFVDPHNEGRSVVAEAHALLFREWTVRTGGHWPINAIHSAGLLIQSRGNAAPIQQSLGTKGMVWGDKSPSSIAMAALFDGLPFTYAYKDAIRKKLSQRRSRGLSVDLFTTYDYIMVFNRYNLASLENLRDVLVHPRAQEQPSGKGKLLLLGEYSTTTNKEIFDARKGSDGKENLENWKVTVSIIKQAFQNFLKKELGWIQPLPGAVQAT